MVVEKKMNRFGNSVSKIDFSKVPSKYNETKVAKMLKFLKVSNMVKRNSSILNFEEIFEKFATNILKNEKYEKIYSNLSKIRISETERLEKYFLNVFKKFIKTNYGEEINKFSKYQELLEKTNPYLK